MAPIEAVAIAIYDTDEDMLDENISACLAVGQTSWSESRHPRLAWEQLEHTIRQAYRRRALAALAAASY